VRLALAILLLATLQVRGDAVPAADGGVAAFETVKTVLQHPVARTATSPATRRSSSTTAACTRRT
jgi:hypothetical protein